MTDNKTTRTALMSTRPALHEDEAEAENFGLEATLAWRSYIPAFREIMRLSAANECIAL